MTTIEHRPTPPSAREAAEQALLGVTPAVAALARALAELRLALPPEQRAEATQTFMNAFGNAVWSAARS